MPKGECGCVTATKHIGLDSFRVRNCELGANRRFSLSRESKRWNLEFELGCEPQSSGCCARGESLVSSCDSRRRPPFVDGMELRVGNASREFCPVQDGCRKCPVSIPDQRIRRISSSLTTDSVTATTGRADHSCGMVLFSDRNSPFFILFKPDNSLGTPMHPLRHGSGFRHSVESAVAFNGSQCLQRTHSSIRVSNEKRNVDECPPTGGKSNCHR